MKVLVTGFDPFGGEKVNPAYEAVKRLNDNIKGAEVVKVEIPTVFGKSIKRLEEAIEREDPDIVICVGQAGGRNDIAVERVAINLSDSSITDNEGNQPVDEQIFEDGENAYFATIPIKAMVQKMREGGIPASISNTAGTYVCNHTLYGLLYLIDKKYPNIRGGFVHVPFLPKQAIDKRKAASMNLNDIVKGLTLGIEAAIEYKEDMKTLS